MDEAVQFSSEEIAAIHDARLRRGVMREGQDTHGPKTHNLLEIRVRVRSARHTFSGRE